ncbi:MAG TPA: flavin reductase family protein [Thermoanaerobaculia bacterium]|nr:flavin reductase family protein [Thermoanaerobaculia bacterium]
MDELVVAVEDATFKRAMSHFLSGVTVVTTVVDGTRYGLTVASFASLSLNPPLVLVCVEKNVKSHEAIPRAEKFAVSILAENQQNISNQFAGRSEDRFAGIETVEGKLGLPLIAGAICTIECRLHSTLPGGDHSIFVGEVIGAQFEEGQPLGYFRSGYHKIV